MPTDAIDISTTVEAAPPTGPTYGLPLVAGEETDAALGDAAVDTIVKIETYSEAETQFGTDSELTYEIKGVLDEAGAPVYGYKFDIDYGGGETYPTDATVSELKSQLEKYPEIESIVYASVDMITDETDIDNLASVAEEKELMMILDAETGDPTAITGLSSISDSKNIFPVAHNYTSEEGVAGKFMGVVVRIEPYEKLMWKQINTLPVERFYTGSEVDTIEGENVNAVIPKGGSPVFSNGMTFTGEELYKWVDGVRSKFYIKNTVEGRLTNLIASSHLPYSGRGFSKIRDSLRRVCRELMDVGMIESYSVEMPNYDEIPASDRDNRILKGVKMAVKIAGHIQAINIDLTLRF